MNFLRSFFRKTNPIILGRWNLKYDENLISRTVYLANEDHCGCCENKKKEDDEDYYMPFCLMTDIEAKNNGKIIKRGAE